MTLQTDENTANGELASHAEQTLANAAKTLQSRGVQYEAGATQQQRGERSMEQVVAVFNALHPEVALTPYQGWRFMVCLKLVRAGKNGLHYDSELDATAYQALAAEARIAEDSKQYEQRNAENAQQAIAAREKQFAAFYERYGNLPRDVLDMMLDGKAQVTVIDAVHPNYVGAAMPSGGSAAPKKRSGMLINTEPVDYGNCPHPLRADVNYPQETNN